MEYEFVDFQQNDVDSRANSFMPGKKMWWSGRTFMEKVLLIASSFGCLICIALLVSLCLVLVENRENMSSSEVRKIAVDVCTAKTCIQESARILTRMNNKTDPCEDFYEFACGDFLRETVIPDDEEFVMTYTLIENKLYNQLRTIVNEPLKDDEIEPFKNVKRLFRACTNTGAIESRGLAPIKAVIDSLGGWPVVDGDSWNKNRNWTWQKSMIDSVATGYPASYLFTFQVEPDSKNTTKRSITITGPSYTSNLASPDYVKTKSFLRDLSFRVDLAVLFGAERSRAESELQEALEFEDELEEIAGTGQQSTFYNPKTISRIHIDYPGIDWLSLFNNMLPHESKLNKNDIVIVEDLWFFSRLSSLLRNTPKRVVANHIAYHQAVSSVHFLPEAFRKVLFEATKPTSGAEVWRPRWHSCISVVSKYYPQALGALFVRKFLNPKAKAKVSEIVQNIKTELRTEIKESSWMQWETKQEAIKKAEAMKEQIGYADDLMNDEKIAEYHKTFAVDINETRYYESVLKLRVALLNRNNKKLREPVDGNDLRTQVPPIVANAFYLTLENTIRITAATINGGFFNADRPQYMNYGEIGRSIGHEIFHGFDNSGKFYDGDGNLRNWWDEVSSQAFEAKSHCIVDQYGDFVDPTTKLKLNGLKTLGENMADINGIKASYRAYVQWAQENSDPKLPGLAFTPQQMFWIAAGQAWCGVYRPEFLRDFIKTNVHSPARFRVTGMMTNSKEFAKDFHCSAEAPMNPSSKCDVW